LDAGPLPGAHSPYENSSPEWSRLAFQSTACSPSIDPPWCPLSIVGTITLYRTHQHQWIWKGRKVGKAGRLYSSVTRKFLTFGQKSPRNPQGNQGLIWVREGAPIKRVWK
jgi:hypothetical protein